MMVMSMCFVMNYNDRDFHNNKQLQIVVKKYECQCVYICEEIHAIANLISQSAIDLHFFPRICIVHRIYLNTTEFLHNSIQI